MKNRKKTSRKNNNHQSLEPLLEQSKVVTSKIKSPIRDRSPHIDAPKGDECKFDVDKTSVFGNLNMPFGNVQHVSKEDTTVKSGRAKRGRSPRSTRTGKKNAEDKKGMFPTVDNAEYHLDATTGLLIPFMPVTCVKDMPDKVALAEKEYNFSDFEEEKNISFPMLHRGTESLCAREKIVPANQNTTLPENDHTPYMGNHNKQEDYLLGSLTSSPAEHKESRPKRSTNKEEEVRLKRIEN